MSSNIGNPWSAINTGLTDSYVNAFAISGNAIFAGTNLGGVFVSTNNGASWYQNNFGLPYTYILSFTIIGDNIFAGTNGGGVWKGSIADLTESVKENSIDKITIYPNPAKDKLTIATKSNKEQKVEIVNLIGQTVYNCLGKDNITIDITAFANGVYILKLNSENGTMLRKFVKM